MAQQNINLGTANGEDGDYVREAFSKAEDNFTELYALQYYTDRIISGSASWTGSGLTFDVVVSLYIINGGVLPLDNIPITDQITLPGADATNPRIDIIVINEDETISSIQGTPAANPLEPTPEFETQLKITSVLISAGATTPDNTSLVLVYDENTGSPTEWTTSESTAAIRINVASTTDPYVNSTHIETIGWQSADYFEFTADSTVTVDDFSTLSFKLKNTEDMSDTSIGFYASLYSSGTLVSTAVSIRAGLFGYDESNEDDYQTILISSEDFAVTGDFDSIRITNGRTDNSSYFDEFTLTFGLDNPPSADTFLELNDTPSTYSTSEGFFVRVNSSGTALEFVDSEWSTYTGTRAGADLIVTLGDYDDSGQSTKIIIDDENEEIYITAPSGGQTIVNSELLIKNNNDLVFSDSTNTYSAGLSPSNITAIRTWTLPDASGTIALTSDLLNVDLQDVLDAGDTWVSANTYETFSIETDQSNGGITYVNSDEGWGYFINAEEGLNMTDGSGGGSGLNQFWRSGMAIGGGTYQASLYAYTITANRVFQFPDASGTLALTSEIESYSEWASYTGTRVGADLVVTIGDYDEEGNGTYLVIDDETAGVIKTNIGTTLQASEFSIFDGTYDASIVTESLTGNRTLTFQDATGTIALTSDIESYSEWAEYSGTRAASNLLVTLGDYDNSGEGNKIIIDNSNNLISIVAEGNDSYPHTFSVDEVTINSSLSIGNDDDYKGQISSSILTANRTYNLPDASGTLALTSDITDSEWATYTGTRSGGDLVLLLGDYDEIGGATNIEIDDANFRVTLRGNTNVESSVYTSANFVLGSIGATYTGSLQRPTYTASRTWTFPDATGTVALISDIDALTLQDVTEVDNSTTVGITLTTDDNDFTHGGMLSVTDGNSASNYAGVTQIQMLKDSTSSNSFESQVYSEFVTNGSTSAQRYQYWNTATNSTNTVQDSRFFTYYNDINLTGQTPSLASGVYRNNLDVVSNYANTADPAASYITANKLTYNNGGATTTITESSVTYNEVNFNDANLTVAEVYSTNNYINATEGTVTEFFGSAVAFEATDGFDVTTSLNLITLSYDDSTTNGITAQPYAIYSGDDIPTYFRGDLEMGDGTYKANITNEGTQTADISLNLPYLDGTIARVEDIGLQIVDDGNGNAYRLADNDGSGTADIGSGAIDLGVYSELGFANAISLTESGSFTADDGTYFAKVLSTTGSGSGLELIVTITSNTVSSVDIIQDYGISFVANEVVTLQIAPQAFNFSEITFTTRATVTIDSIYEPGPANSNSIALGESNIFTDGSGADDYGGCQTYGYRNRVSGWYANIAMGVENKIYAGYGSFAAGLNNIIDTGSYSGFGIGGGIALGAYNYVDGLYGTTIGQALYNASNNSVAVGTGNSIYTGSKTATDRPIFTVGIGEMSTSTVTFGQGYNRADGFNVLKDGTVLADSLTETLIDAESTGKVLTTKEWILSHKSFDRLNVDSTVSGTYDIVWSDYETHDLTLTGTTTITDSGYPPSSYSKVLTLYITGNHSLTLPTNWTTNIIGEYDQQAPLNQLVVEYISNGKYWLTISQGT